ncbi:TonB-dependent receptor plug domain-containing protein [Brevundimonas bacteroides]|uniref:TonB-dependent receptor plug domain-containing protein n=1 Tax=Brevundimonas bacteroides TaxID=74311 RepID=UPI000A011B19|nr:TonB-dependent receptor [Brevundimonas bacteroides]
MTTMRHTLLRSTMLAGVAGVLSFTLSSQAAAQEVQPQDDATTVEEIVVTGSRIPRPNLEQPTPVATVSSEAIATSGTQDLGSIIAELPALSSNSTVRGNSDSFGDSGGLNFPDLRSLGSARTLTLVDGKRHVGGDAGNAAVDLNAIPAALVERVEVITGGASAIYGSDAVSGVVNIILKDDFEGAEITVQGGRAESGDGTTYSANGVFGRNFLDGRLNVTASLFYDHADQVLGSDIPALQDFGTILNPADPTQDPDNGIPDRILVPNVLTDYLDENGVIFDANTFDIITAIRNNGSPVPQQPRLGDNSFAFGQFLDCETCTALDDYVVLQPETDRYGTNIRLRYDLTDSVTAYFDGKYVRSEILDYVQPSFTFGEYLIAPDNAFLTPELQAVIGGRDITFGRFNADIGPRVNDITRETYRAVAGVRGRTETGFADFDWDLSYNYGETQNEFISENGIIPGNYAAAIDAVRVGGQIVCRDQTPDLTTQTAETCVPFNPFGQQNSQAAIDYVNYTAVRNHKITQEVITGVFNFDTSKFFNLQGGPIGIAGGFEYREETSENINDPLVQSGITENAPQPDAFGQFDVTEGFIEFNAPILADLPFAYRLSLDGAYRYADYSTVGGAEAWKVGAIYAPIRDISFRGTYSRAVRAPNITEAFLPATAGFFSVTDPCDVDNIQDDPDRTANCAAAGVPAGFQSNTNQSIEGVSSGNANLDAEEAESFTYGVVVQPRFLPGVTFTADYYDIQIDDAIALIGAQDIIDNCYDASGGLDGNFCSLFTRNAAGNIDSVQTTYVNAAALTTKGWDFEVTGRRVLDADRWGFLAGTVTSSFTANYLEELNFFAFADRPDEIDVEAGEVGDPEWSYKSRMTWDNGTWAVTGETRYEGRVARYDVTPTPGVIGSESVFPNEVPGQWYHDVVVRYRLNDGLWAASNVELFAGVNNLTDNEIPYGLAGNGTSSAYDLYGRQFFGGIRARF